METPSMDTRNHGWDKRHTGKIVDTGGPAGV
jgi:hypothetical protein